MPKKQNRKSGGNRKKDRMREKCLKYKNNKTREKNKVRKLTKYLKTHPNNLVAVEALKKYQAFVGQV